VNQTIVVVGGGAMGAGIAAVAAGAGFDVALIEPDADAHARIAALLAKNAERAGDPSVATRVTVMTALPASIDAGLVIEAAPERLDVKRDIFARLASALPDTALLATNTSSLSVDEIAAEVPLPQRVLGLHFFNPPVVMNLVEIVRAASTGDAEIELARAYVERFGKTAVIAADTPGFIVNRIARPFYLQALAALQLDVAPIEDLDALARGAGFRMGPFELMDLIGLDVNLATSESIYERTGAARLAPSGLQREMVADGRLGRKSGAGFYEYPSPEGEPDRGGSSEPIDADVNADEVVVLTGFGSLGDEMNELLSQRFERVSRIENDDDIASVSPATTIAIDVGDGTSDRLTAILELDGALPREAAIFVDAYVTDVHACLARMQHPERLIGYGILGALERQRIVEIVDTESVSDDALALAEEVFGAMGVQTSLVENQPGLFLGRLVGSIVNEAVIAVEEGVASVDDVDAAMRLGVNYPIGPLAWGREIGGARIARILRAVAKKYGDEYGPHRALWILDIDEERVPEELADA
jgi:3-hydroxybutyryl-CoA dehydrogenase